MEKFRKSELAARLQKALENRALEKRNWLEDWWYDVYTTIRSPLAPFTSVAAVNTVENLQNASFSKIHIIIH